MKRRKPGSRTPCTLPRRPSKRASSPAAAWPWCAASRAPEAQGGGRRADRHQHRQARSRRAAAHDRPERRSRRRRGGGESEVEQQPELRLNAQTEAFGDLVNEGVIDPTRSRASRCRTPPRLLPCPHHRGVGQRVPRRGKIRLPQDRRQAWAAGCTKRQPSAAVHKSVNSELPSSWTDP